MSALGSVMGTYAPAPVRFVAGRGSELFDEQGRRYLDFCAGIAVTSLGHAHPAVTAAVAEQAGTLSHVSNLFGHRLSAPLAQRIDTLLGDGEPLGGQVFFANSGAEANECALKLARRDDGSGRYVVVTATGSFHGRTLATLAATGQPAKHAAFEPMPAGFTSVPYGDLDALRHALGAPEVAGVLLEPIEAEGGVFVPPPGYLHAVRRDCDDLGVLLMLDEVQTGCGRTGRWFAFQHEGILPDVVTLAKALGNGFPIGACWARPEIAQRFRPGDHGSTFGGQPLGCAAAIATLDTLAEIDAPARAAARGAQLARLLGRLSGVKEVRGAGLLVGVGLEAGLDATAVALRALEQGLVVSAPAPGVLRLTPALTVSAEEVAEAATLLERALR
jgi:acetylornithine/N-succinyldiaminopimelate aminotransferase